MLEPHWCIRQWEGGTYHSLLGDATWIMEEEYHVM